MAIWMVQARSAAEMPVVTPSAASIDSQNAVPKRDVFIGEIRGRWSWSQRSGASARQINPRPCRAIKLIASGVTNWAAMVRSPSFSRSSSSTTTSMRPARISSIASGIVAKAMVDYLQDSVPGTCYYFVRVNAASVDNVPPTLKHPAAARFWLALAGTGIIAGLGAAALTRLLEAVQRLVWGGTGRDLL